jgi:hypothetical protein
MTRERFVVSHGVTSGWMRSEGRIGLLAGSAIHLHSTNMAQTYFACTLGQASQLKPHPFLSLNHLLDVQAEAHPNLPVVGMPVPKDSEEWGIHILSTSSIVWMPGSKQPNFRSLPRPPLLNDGNGSSSDPRGSSPYTHDRRWD